MADKPQVRIKAPGQHALLNPATGLHESPGITDYFDVDHPLVKAHGWAFATDAELAETERDNRAREWASLAEIEQATAVPGEKRPTRRA